MNYCELKDQLVRMDCDLQVATRDERGWVVPVGGLHKETTGVEARLVATPCTHEQERVLSCGELVAVLDRVEANPRNSLDLKVVVARTRKLGQSAIDRGRQVYGATKESVWPNQCGVAMHRNAETTDGRKHSRVVMLECPR